jgi:hypothetical protein
MTENPNESRLERYGPDRGSQSYFNLFLSPNATRRHPPTRTTHSPLPGPIPRTASPIVLTRWRNCAALRVGRRAIAGGGWFPFSAPNRRVRLAAWEPCLDQRALPDEANRAAAKDGELWREDG